MIIVIRIVGEPSIIAGRLVEETDSHLVLSYPGMAQMVPVEDGYKTTVMPLVPGIITNQVDLLNRFCIDKDKLLYFGELTEEWHPVYEQFEKELIADIVGSPDPEKLH